MATKTRFVAKNGLNNNSNTITSVADPVNAQDAATKNFSSNANNLTSGTINDARIPSLNWSKITTGKPTTLSGYGITDAVSTASRGVANGIATLDANGKVTASQLPMNNTAFIGDTPPTNPWNGVTWYCTNDGRTYVYYIDTDSSQWVESSPQSGDDVPTDKMTLNAAATDLATAIALVNQIRAGLIANGFAK